MPGEDLFEDVTPTDLEAWAAPASSLSPSAYADRVARATTQSQVVLAYEAAIRSGRADVAQAAREAAARRFPHAEQGARLLQLEGHTANVREREILETASTIELDAETKQAWRSYLLEGDRHAGDVIAALAANVFDEATAGAAVDKPEDLAELGRLATSRQGLFTALATVAPARLVARVRNLTLHEEMTPAALGSLYWVLRFSGGKGVEALVADAGAVVGSETRNDLLSVLSESRVSPELLARIRGIADAHEALSRATVRGAPLMAQGIHAHLLELARRQPDDWAQYLRFALWRRGADSFLVRPTLSAAKRSERVLAVLKEMVEKAAPTLRDQARGLLMLLDGTGERPSRSALLRLVELVDGPGAFPHPLLVRSSTWLGSLELEALLRGRIDLAAGRLARDLPERMRRNEEKITTRILTMIEEGLRDAREVAAEATEVGRRVEIACSSRELSRPEENDDGADIAWVLDVDVPDVIRFKHAEFTQSKKAVRENGRFVNKWDVDVAQLKTLRGRSETAVYWLYGPDGTIHVVPARLLFAILVGQGRDANDKARFDLGHVRSMAIPVSQFLVDLFTGAWLGTTNDRALAIARGDDDDRPDVVFEISVRAKPAE